MKNFLKTSLGLLFLIIVVGQSQVVDAKSILIKSSVKKLPIAINKINNSLKREYVKVFAEVLKITTKKIINRDLWISAINSYFFGLFF